MAANQVWAQPPGSLSQRLSATWTSATAANTALTLQVAGYSTAGVTYGNNALAISAGVLTFEIDNGSNTWWPVTCYPLSGVGGNNSYALTGANQAFQCPVAGFVQMRVRLSTQITGNNALVSLQASAGRGPGVMPVTTSANATVQNANNGLQFVGAISEKGSRIWRTSAPAVNNQATLTIAAPGAGVTHVLDALCFSAAANTAPAATQVNFIVSDNIHGNWFTLPLEFPASAGILVPPTCVSGLQIVTNPNSALTVQFSAGVANVFEGLSVGTYTIQ